MTEKLLYSAEEAHTMLDVGEKKFRALHVPARLTANVSETAEMLGVSTEKFRVMRKDSRFPLKPLPYCKNRFYIKAIEQYLDKASEIKTESETDDDIIFRRLAGGEGAREIPSHT